MVGVAWQAIVHPTEHVLVNYCIVSLLMCVCTVKIIYTWRSSYLNKLRKHFKSICDVLVL